MIADDEKIERKGITALLQMENYDFEILEAVNGKDALRQIKEKKTDILLSDIRMPFMDGLELAREVRKLDPDMAIVIFSGFSDFNYAKEAIRNGVQEYILKPVNPQEFSDTMKKVMKYLDEKNETEELLQKNQDFLEQYFLLKYIRSGKTEVIREAMEVLDVSWWKTVGRMISIEASDSFFENYAGDFEKMLTEELQLPLHYLNVLSGSSLLFFDRSVKVDYHILAKHIHEFVQKSCGAEIYVAVSSMLEGEQAIPEGTKELESLMENRYYRPDQWIFMPDSNWENRENYELPLEMIEKMEEDIRLHDITHLWEHFRRFVECKEQGARFSYIYMNFACTNLVKNMYADMEYPIEKYTDVIEKLFRVENIQEVVEILEQTIHIFETTLFSSQSSSRSEVEKVKSYIYAHYQEDISLEFLGKAVYLSPGYMSYIFKKETGEGISQFIRKFRLEKAKELLCTTNKKIVQICTETGFTNASYFCKSFREFYGCSPEKFRRTEGKKEAV
ncbi:response regulator transcription factor [Blautia sp. MSJ-19]|uniref:response regulator transcription factor n=1 Tax=Blautia sp. MSJ-19 TaxID=2841517 RepID=UPI001C0EC8B5|nr:response regulator [Blautia sp. MSJ-19]MBU5482283.1 response regulator [Blautia sp. MSJ-19]